MKKINKTCNLSTDYKNWENEFNQSNQPHPRYNSSNNRFYWDIVMQLLNCQHGLCAYTEVILCHHSHLFHQTNWHNGKYASDIPKGSIKGSLDHFNPNLKSKDNKQTQKKDWLWDNFFIVDTDINSRIKKEQNVDNILKPDTPSYDPFTLLDYDIENHTFLPNTEELDAQLIERVRKMINILGINIYISKRAASLKNQFQKIFLKESDWDILRPIEFPTAFEFCKRKCLGGEIDLEDLIEL